MTAHCAIPDWFDALLTEARTDLATAETRHTERTTRRERRLAAVAAFERTLSEVDAATAPDREALEPSATR